MAVGGVNEKILGFFELCVERGLTGTQGVLIPASNVDDLMLDPAVVESVRKRKFHLWSIEHIDQGIALLANATSRSVYQAVEERLDAWSKGSKETEAT
jgi:predicted ATP-dependent protease